MSDKKKQTKKLPKPILLSERLDAMQREIDTLKTRVYILEYRATSLDII